MDLASRSDYIEVPMNDIELEVLNKDYIKPRPSNTILNEPIAENLNNSAQRVDIEELEEAILIETDGHDR